MAAPPAAWAAAPAGGRWLEPASVGEGSKDRLVGLVTTVELGAAQRPLCRQAHVAGQGCAHPSVLHRRYGLLHAISSITGSLPGGIPQGVQMLVGG
jgi:hypothetical protein